MPQIAIIFVRVMRKPQRTLDQRTFADDLTTAIDPNLTTVRYKRTWRFSQPRRIDKDFFVGKLGFISAATATKTYYDEKLKDFVDESFPTREGCYAQLAVDLPSQVMAFETKPPNIRLQSFVGAFKGLLDQHPELALTIEYIAESAKFYEWAKRMDRISRFKALLRAPNPNFADYPRSIRQLLEDTNADQATVEVSKEVRSTESLKIENTILNDMIEYGKDGYSTITAKGLKDEETKVFDSKRKVAAERVDVPDAAGVEVIWQKLVEVLRKLRT